MTARSHSRDRSKAKTRAAKRRRIEGQEINDRKNARDAKREARDAAPGAGWRGRPVTDVPSFEDAEHGARGRRFPSRFGEGEE